MSEEISTALGRALSYCSGVGDGSLEGFIDRAAWELYHESSAEFTSLAIIIRRGDGSSFVGRPKELPALPVETLLGMLIEEGGSQVACRVRDHALDTVRFIDARFRTSIVLRVVVPKALLPSGEAAIWVGLQGSATAKRIELAQTVATTLSKWLAVYAPVLVSVRLFGERLSGLRVRLGEMTALAHDAKAPIGALKYLISDVAVEYPQIYDETGRLQEELLYIEKLLAKFAPKEVSDSSLWGGTCDISTVIRRVCDRFSPESLERGNRCLVTFPLGTRARTELSELDLERVVSNVIGNAVRYSGGGEIRIELHDRLAPLAVKSGREGSQWIIRVCDNGPGIPQSVIDRVAVGDVQCISSYHGGWGVGLVACKAALVAQGGDLLISSSSQGATVDIVVPQAFAIEQRDYVGQEMSPESERLGILREAEAKILPSGNYDREGVVGEVRDGGVVQTERREVALVIVDDDGEHTSSLERLLERKDVPTKSFGSVDAASAFILREPAVLVLCDAHMPDGGAERLLRLLATRGCKARCAVMSGEVNDELLYRYAALSAREFFAKPIDIEGVIAWVRGEGVPF